MRAVKLGLMIVGTVAGILVALFGIFLIYAAFEPNVLVVPSGIGGDALWGAIFILSGVPITIFCLSSIREEERNQIATEGAEKVLLGQKKLKEVAYCRRCGYQNTDDANFCRNCGLQLKAELEIKRPSPKTLWYKAGRRELTTSYPPSPYYVPTETRGSRIGKLSLVLIFLVIVFTTSNVMTYISLWNLNKQQESMTHEYSSVQSSYNNLKSSYEKIKSDYESVLRNYESLNRSVSGLFNILCYYSIPEAFKRSLNDGEVRETSSVVSTICDRNDFWGTHERIYNYITSNIKYAYDVDMPHIVGYSGIWYGSKYYISDFTIKNTRDYVQSPSLTLKISQGDCEDQAVLAYAMMKYYEKYVCGVEYSLYIAEITFNDGNGHVSLIRPVKGGKICIIDPAMHYLTSTSDWWGLLHKIASKDVRSELQAYSNHCMLNGGISYVKLYEVNISDGSYRVVAEGNLSELAVSLGES